jgi:hypothetical protein
MAAREAWCCVSTFEAIGQFATYFTLIVLLVFFVKNLISLHDDKAEIEELRRELAAHKVSQSWCVNNILDRLRKLEGNNEQTKERTS